MKKIIYILLSLAVVVAVVITFAVDPMGKNYAQNYAQKLLKTPVNISQFEAKLLDKSLNIDFIEVRNPPNFKNKNAFSLDHFSLNVGDESDDDLVIIDELNFSGLKFVLEQSGASVNLEQLLENLKLTSDSDSDSADSEEHFEHHKRIKIKKFTVDNISLEVDTDLFEATLAVPNISASNFGGETGASVDEIGKEILQAILQNLQNALEEEGIEAGKEQIKQTLMRKLGVDMPDDLSIDGLTEQIKNSFDGSLKDKASDLLKKFDF
jgi:hypothetical protein